MRALELARDATGDPRFAEALQAVFIYGFDKELKRTAKRVRGEIFVDMELEHLDQVTFLRKRGKLEIGGRRRRLSAREACEMVVAESGLPGPSFAAAVEHVRQRSIKQHSTAR